MAGSENVLRPRVPYGLLVGGIVTLTTIDVTVNYARFTESAKDLQSPNITKTAHIAKDGWIAETAATHAGSEATRTTGSRPQANRC